MSSGRPPVSMPRTRSEGGSHEPSRRRLARRVARRPQGAARQGEGAHPPPRRAERRAPPAADGRGSRRTTASRAPTARRRLLDLFEGRRQLIVVPLHVRPELGGRLPELHRRRRRDVRRPARATCTPATRRSRTSSRAPIAKIEALQGASGAGRSRGTRRSAATSTTTSTSRSTSASRPSEYNYRAKAEHEARGTGYYFAGDGQSHRAARLELLPARWTTTSSTPTRSTRAARETTGGSYYFLDNTALGRQEEWEEPRGRAVDPNEARPDFA